MVELVIGLCVGTIFFIVTILAYTLGIKHGKLLSQKIVPEVNFNPIQAITKAVEQHKEKVEAEEASNDLDALLNYNIETALAGIKRVNS
ncbi:hypothetical protein [Dehalobacter restrictus]|uniref:Uncharacterized protein n=1 Tax=Dehalobacter restrictus TaxID=55583 RepID=A0A857DGM1_9FIRM|nr:hypothetical protein [Dehalobacter restrictus]QGZ99424.1 hypothetical protein GQ588_01460 [Dehalobacter restrictus]